MDVLANRRSYACNAEGDTIDPSILQQPTVLQHYNEHSVGDEDPSFALPLPLSSFSDQNFCEEDSLLRGLDFDLVHLDATQQSLPIGPSGNNPTLSFLSTFPSQSFYDQIQSFPASPIDAPAAQDNTSSTGLSAATPTDLPPGKEQIQRSTTFHCSICRHNSGTIMAYKRHKRTHESYPCEIAGCNTTFTTSTNRRRHHAAVHKRTQIYHCQCGKRDTRKDNHRRHVQSCARDKGNQYFCSCGFFTTVKEEHLAHTITCGSQKNRASINATKSNATSRE